MRRVLGGALIGLLVLAAVSYGVLQVSKSRGFQFYGGLVNRVETSEKVVALTFDDGPTGNTGQVLEVLDRAGVKATFFVMGSDLEKYPEEGRKIAAAGHELGNHSYSHKRIVLKSPSFIKSEIERTDRLIREAGYTGEIHFRPPFGKKLVLLPYYLRQYNKKTIMWDVEPDSFPEVAASSDKIIEYAAARVRPGSIILLHVMNDSRGESVRAVEGLVRALRNEGYTFKTVSELLGYQN